MAPGKKLTSRERVDLILDGPSAYAPPLVDAETPAFDPALLEQDVRDAVAVPAPIRTQERDPAHRLAWKRERAKALGHDRH